MAKLTIILLLMLGEFGCKPINADKDTDEGPDQQFTANFYVAVDGNDKGPGTSEKPFATLQAAWNAAKAYDLIYVRGGEYIISGNITRYADLNKKNFISVLNYPGERPVFNAAEVNPQSTSIVIELRNSNNCKIRGLRVTNLDQASHGSSYGFHFDNISNCVIESCEADHIGGVGFSLNPYSKCNNNLFHWCDSHHNDDYNAAAPHGAGDGFTNNRANPTDTNSWIGCRSWWNSDDGFDFWGNEGVCYLDSCWSFRNGYVPNTWDGAGDGQGFKLGDTFQSKDEIFRKLTHCIAFDNRKHGFDENNAMGKIVTYNSIAFRNGSIGIRYDENIGHTVRNCVSLNNGYRNMVFGSSVTQDHNSWNFELGLSEFKTTDTLGVSGPRNKKGGLPDLDFFRLVQGSNLIDKGIDVGLSYEGGAPEIGAFEY